MGKNLKLINPRNVVLLLCEDTAQAIRFEAEAHLASFFVEALLLFLLYAHFAVALSG
jgi:hypothetical protein